VSHSTCLRRALPLFPSGVRTRVCFSASLHIPRFSSSIPSFLSIIVRVHSQLFTSGDLHSSTSQFSGTLEPLNIIPDAIDTSDWAQALTLSVIGRAAGERTIEKSNKLGPRYLINPLYCNSYFLDIFFSTFLLPPLTLHFHTTTRSTLAILHTHQTQWVPKVCYTSKCLISSGLLRTPINAINC
jgi:hypothetical protein